MNRAKLATRLLEMRAEGISILRIYAKSWQQFLSRIIILSFTVFGYLFLDSPLLFVFAGGLLLGAMLEDLHWTYGITKYWSFTDEVTDWAKVEEIAKDS